ncbi:MAG: prolyl oligopeptidase family serine peptidase [Bryobacteraceae bacterium]
MLWLEDRRSPAVEDWLVDQAARTRCYLDAWPERRRLLARAAELLSPEHVDNLLQTPSRLYYLKREQGEDQASIWMESKAETRMICSASEIDPSGRGSFELLAASRDGRFVAVGRRTGCEKELSIELLDSKRGRLVSLGLDPSEYRGVVFDERGDGFFYAAPGPSGWRIIHRRFRAPLAERTIFEVSSADTKLGVAPGGSEAELLVLTVHVGPPRRVDLHLLRRQRDEPISLLANSKSYYGAIVFGKYLYLLTDYKADRRRIVRVPIMSATDCSAWECVVPEDDAVIREMAISAGRIVFTRSSPERFEIAACRLDGSGLRTALDGPVAHVGHLIAHPDSDTFYCSVESWDTPQTIFRLSPAGANRWWVKRPHVDSQEICFRREYRPTDAGSRVPVYLLWHKEGAVMPRRALLTAYGGYGVARFPRISARAALWMEFGGVVAIAGVRGGGEFGSAWREAGRGSNRLCAVEDLLAVAEWLLSAKLTTRSQLAIAGSSYGGLMAASAFTRRPDLFAAALCTSSLFDLLRFDRFQAGRWAIRELGDPSDSQSCVAFRHLSPYHQVIQGTHYPAVMLEAGDADTVVDPMHARKMAARLQEASSSAKPVLLHYQAQRGHGGQLPLRERAANLADQLTFLLRNTESQIQC